MGYFAQESTDFEFIGPDRHPVAITTLLQLLDIADIIRNTGFLNYKVARNPIDFGLNVKAWEFHLQNYLDKQIPQCIKFGFPLSLTGASELGNKKRLVTIIQHVNILNKYKSTLIKRNSLVFIRHCQQYFT